MTTAYSLSISHNNKNYTIDLTLNPGWKFTSTEGSQRRYSLFFKSFFDENPDISPLQLRKANDEGVFLTDGTKRPLPRKNVSVKEVLLVAPGPEGPMKKKEWLSAFIGLLFLIVALLVWFAVGSILFFPALLFKKFSAHFSKKTQKRIDAVYAFSTEIFCLIGAGFKYISSYFKRYEVEGKGQPILLVHGYLYNNSCWSHYLKHLKKEKLGPVYTINLGHPFLSLETYVKKLEEKALSIQKQTGRKDLVLIGHSMGGVVSSLYATKIAPEGSVTDVFTIGSPLKGSPLANFLAVGPNGRAMRTDSPLLEELRRAIVEKKNMIRFYHVGSDADMLVPAERALLEGSGKQLRVSDSGHMHLITSNKVSEWICSALKNLRA